jgi:hypothetical protein
MLEALKKPSPRMTPDAMGAHLADLRAREVDLRTRYDKAALAAADGTGSQSAADAAHAALQTNRGAIERTADVLAAIDRREAADQATHRAKVVDDAWASTIDHAKLRITLAQRLAASLKTAGQDYAAFVAATTQMHRSLPSGFPIHSTYSFGIGPNFAPDMIRVEYARNGLPGGPALEGRTPQALDQRCGETVQCIAEARALSKESAPHG